MLVWLTGLELNGAAQAWNSFVDNLAVWDFTALLAAGETLDVFVTNPGHCGGGNTQTDITVTAVDNSVSEPDSLALVLLSFAVLGAIRRRNGAA